MTTLMFCYMVLAAAAGASVAGIGFIALDVTATALARWLYARHHEAKVKDKTP